MLLSNSCLSNNIEDQVTFLMFLSFFLTDVLKLSPVDRPSTCFIVAVEKRVVLREQNYLSSERYIFMPVAWQKSLIWFLSDYINLTQSNSVDSCSFDKTLFRSTTAHFKFYFLQCSSNPYTLKIQDLCYCQSSFGIFLWRSKLCEIRASILILLKIEIYERQIKSKV